MKIERETIKCEIGNFMILMKYYIAKERRRNFLSWDSFKTAKTRYIYIYKNEDWERDKQIWDYQFHDVNEILYRQGGKKIQYFISWDTCKSEKIYMNIFF